MWPAFVAQGVGRDFCLFSEWCSHAFRHQFTRFTFLNDSSQNYIILPTVRLLQKNWRMVQAHSGRES